MFSSGHLLVQVIVVISFCQAWVAMKPPSCPMCQVHQEALRAEGEKGRMGWLIQGVPVHCSKHRTEGEKGRMGWLIQECQCTVASIELALPIEITVKLFYNWPSIILHQTRVVPH